MRLLFLIIISCLMAGCAGMNAKFDCPRKPGVYCESLDQVNARVSRGELGNNTSEYSKPITFQSAATIQDSNARLKGLKEPLRYGETVMHLWVAPFEDAEGNYHQASDIYTVVHPSFWIHHPPKSIIGEQST